MKFRTAIVASAICLGLDPAFAAAPAGLLNKTIQISFDATRPNIGSDGRSVTSPRTTQITLYISGQGRIFARVVLRHGNFGKDADYGPERTSGNFRFAGSSLIGVAHSGNSARQMTVNFDSGFQSCTFHMMAGGETDVQWFGLASMESRIRRQGQRFSRLKLARSKAATRSPTNGVVLADI
jgi:hypothetical protein